MMENESAAANAKLPRARRASSRRSCLAPVIVSGAAAGVIGTWQFPAVRSVHDEHASAAAFLASAPSWQRPPSHHLLVAVAASDVRVGATAAAAPVAGFGVARRSPQARWQQRQPSRSASTALPAMGPLKTWFFVIQPTLLAVAGIAIWRGGRADTEDGELMQSMWASYANRPVRRMMALMAGGVRFSFVALRGKFAKDPAIKSKLNKEAGIRAVKELVTLGPTYVKLGQIVSCRPDLVPKEYTDELKRLQDEVPAFSGERAKRIIEEELGGTVSDLFDEFDDKPLAAASLGQVHRAKLKDGREVAIKVQRDKLKEMYDLDLAQFDKVTEMLDKYKIGVSGAEQKWGEIFSEAKVILYREIDYNAEAENTRRCAKNFEGLPWAKVPNVIDEYTSEKVLTMEYCPGVKIDNLEQLDKMEGVDREMLGANLAEAYLLQFCKHGFFNTDPHPGNLAVDNQYKGGRIIFYDFGQACELSDSQCDGILQVIQSIVDLDAKACVAAMAKLGALKPGADIQKIEALIENNFKTGKVKSKRSKRKIEEVAEEDGKKKDVPKESETMKFLQLPAQLAFVARALTQLNGVGVMLDEDWEFIDKVAAKVPEVQMEKGAGMDYLVGQFFKQVMK